MQKPLPPSLTVLRGQTQKQVNHTVLTYLYNQFSEHSEISFLDLPCGHMEFLKSLRSLFPHAKLTGADIHPPDSSAQITFKQMDLTEDFTLPPNEKFEVITSISGVMMFSNTLKFIKKTV